MAMSKKKMKKILVKVGSSTVTDQTGRLDRKNMKHLVEQVSDLWAQQIDCIIVTSGAIAAGVEQLNLSHRPLEISKLQAAAAVGQGLLVHRYADLFGKKGIQVAQILLTQFDMAHREFYLNAKHTFDQLLAMRAIPIVNENDTTTVEEIKFGDNDMLAALVAVLVEAEMLIILSDTDGFYTSDPRRSKTEKLETIEEITPDIERMAEGIGSKFGSGGMITKLNAAKIAGAAKIGTYIADGREPEVLTRIINGEKIGTYFKPRQKKVPGRKMWIGYSRIVKGRVKVDNGAEKAIMREGGSLLPAGVVSSHGDFTIGDTIEIVGASGQVIARGLSNYSAEELAIVRGKRTSEIAIENGDDFSEEVVHRDYLVIL